MAGYVPTTAAGGGNSSNDPFASVEQGDGGLIADPGRQIVTGSTRDNPGGYLLQGLNAKGQPTNPGVVSSADSLLRDLFTKSPDEIKALQQRLIDAGFKSVTVNGTADDPTRLAYTSILNNTLLYQAAGNLSFTPDDLIDSLIKANPKGKTVTENSSTVNLTDKITAGQTLNSVFADKLGRRPTDDEVSAFTEALNDYESKNPSTSTSVVSEDGTGAETARQTTQSGKSVDPSAYALQYLNDQHGPEQQAVNQLTWFGIALNALQGGAVNTGLPD